MIDQTRRRLVQAGVLGAVSLLCIKNLVGADQELRGNDHAIAMNVYKQWMTKDLGEPDDYLKGKGLPLADKQSINNCIRDDFASARTEEFDGFILSLTEAAIIASYGQYSLSV